MRTIFRTPTLMARTAVAATGAAAVVAAALVPTGAAVSAPAIDCPEPAPIAGLTRGDAVTGLTVSEGTTPDELTGEVVGVLEDGIAPGLDMVMVDLAGSLVTDPVTGEVDRGIWAGMSGSPVYDDQDRLIGAVAYGFSASPSTYAGVTPAADMYEIIDTYGSGPAARTVDVPSAMARRMAAESDGKASEFQQIRRLRMPVQYNGALGQRRLDKVGRLVDFQRNVVKTTGGAQAAVDIDIVPGGNLAGTLAYGDTTLAGIGTATAICGSDVLGFGHPFNWSGPSGMGMHGADALFIQPDSTFPSFKLANIGTPNGTITQDRLAGIMGVLEMEPEGATVTAHFTSSDGVDRTGSTFATLEDARAFSALIHTLGIADRAYDGIRGGSGAASWTVTFEDEDGTSYTLSDEDMYNSNFDLTFSVTDGLAEALFRIENFRTSDLSITAVDIEGTLDEENRSARLKMIEVRRDGQWVDVGLLDRIVVQSGGQLRTRVTVVTDEGDTLRDVVALQVPRGTADKRGSLLVAGGNNLFERFRAATPQALVRALERSVDNNQVVLQLTLGRGKNAKSIQRRLDYTSVVSGRSVDRVIAR